MIPEENIWSKNFLTEKVFIGQDTYLTQLRLTCKYQQHFQLYFYFTSFFGTNFHFPDTFLPYQFVKGKRNTSVKCD